MDKITALFLFLSLTVFVGCSSWSKEQRIIDRTIEVHGGSLYEKARISFDFREIHYEILKSTHRFEYSRKFTDSIGNVWDVLNNEGFLRTVDGQDLKVTEERMQAYSNSLNSVAYFAFLPYGLNDPAARKQWKGETELEGQTYDIVEVTFDEEGGGDDFEDEFLYWINRDNDRLDYLAYTYHTDGGGLRFRKAINQRLVNGLLIQDYENYKPKDTTVSLGDLEELYRYGKLELLSEIILENVEVEIIEE